MTTDDTLDNILEGALTEILLWIIPVVPQGNVHTVNTRPGEPTPKARRIAQLMGNRIVGKAIDATTGHAWMVVLGYVAQALGLLAGAFNWIERCS